VQKSNAAFLRRRCGIVRRGWRRSRRRGRRATSGDETFENGGEFFGDLLEGSLDGFVFALVKHVDKFLDRYLGCVEFFATFCQFVTLVGEVLVLLEGFFVYTFEAFELFIDFFEPFDNLDQINCCFNRCDGTNLPS
jgi:hypothetical protein